MLPAGVLAAIGIISELMPIIKAGFDMIKKATSEGRDLTDAELDELKAMRKAAINKYVNE